MGRLAEIAERRLVLGGPATARSAAVELHAKEQRLDALRDSITALMIAERDLRQEIRWDRMRLSPEEARRLETIQRVFGAGSSEPSRAPGGVLFRQAHGRTGSSRLGDPSRAVSERERGIRARRYPAVRQRCEGAGRQGGWLE